MEHGKTPCYLLISANLFPAMAIVIVSSRTTSTGVTKLALTGRLPEYWLGLGYLRPGNTHWLTPRAQSLFTCGHQEDFADLIFANDSKASYDSMLRQLVNGRHRVLPLPISSISSHKQSRCHSVYHRYPNLSFVLQSAEYAEGWEDHSESLHPHRRPHGGEVFTGINRN